MSSDLLKEFGSPEVNPWGAAASQISASKISADEDEFGDFEAPETETEWSGMTPASTDREYLQPYNHSSTAKVQGAASGDGGWADFSNESVIFDADEEVTRQNAEAERTFNNQPRLEGPTNHPTTSKKAFTPVSQISAIKPVNVGQGSQKIIEGRDRSLKDASKRQVEATKAADFEAPVTDDEPWVDFEAVEVAKIGSRSSKAPPSHTTKAAEASKHEPPPSNIPPPSILLPLIATIFRSLTTDLKTATSHQPSDPSRTISELRGLTSTIRAAARIIAGRKLRWKRDTLLSQSMKIGPAHSGGKAGGMKLAGVDKAESRREDQEAAEALQVWKQQVGPLRSGFAAAALNGQLHVPERHHERFQIVIEIAENMPVRQGNVSEGVVTAPKCCFLCGIRRDERVVKVDVDVEDSFGEWWVEHWGHVDCVAFWENHKHSLRQR